jgi:hypothetical protein
VDFPDKPAVCAEVRFPSFTPAFLAPLTLTDAQAKVFMRRCLTYSQADRPEVAEAAADPYLCYKLAGKHDAAAAKQPA